MSNPEPDITELEFETDPQETEEAEGVCKIQVDQEGNFVGAHAYDYVVEKVEGGMKLIRPDRITMYMHDAGGVTIDGPAGGSVMITCGAWMRLPTPEQEAGDWLLGDTLWHIATFKACAGALFVFSAGHGPVETRPG
jgi:hypothetical protein